MKTINNQTYQENRQKLVMELDNRDEEVVDICKKLLKISTVNPPSDTREIAYLIGDILKRSGAEVNYYTKEDPVVNVVAKIKGAYPGERLIFNGHLDTFPLEDISEWSVDPLGAIRENDRLYGRGASDMKGGVASSIFAFLLLVKYREYFSGEIVLVLVGDEESGGEIGTEYLINEVPDTIGDVMIKGDAGSPMVLHFGEKAPLMIEIEAKGKAAHGAHVHKGENALDKLLLVIETVKSNVRDIKINVSDDVLKVINDSGKVSEKLSGQGETDTLKNLTVNIGKIAGGVAPNLVPSVATAQVDIRLPIGVSTMQVTEKLDEAISSIQGVSYNVLQKNEPNFTDINHEVFSIMTRCGLEVTGEKPVMNIRVGASDTRFYRQKSIPAVNCGLTPFNMGGPDEYIKISELKDVAKIHALTAFDYLNKNAE